MCRLAATYLVTVHSSQNVFNPELHKIFIFPVQNSITLVLFWWSNPISDISLLKAKEMEGMKASSSSTSSNTGMMSRMKKDCLFFYVSLQEGFRNLKAFFVGQAKKLTARNEQEATEAELRTSKMQVEAADAAEETKKRLSNSKSV